ncbi:MinD/ParA family protein [Mycobacterium sp. ACS4331]|uniref:MinD/ParA family ATP-binding protein n=1 Tax=Mycobacterium sp. ACS4331 TaxID=1834121 RepID=UPI000A8943E0|nr:MinD/ParA family protein [Mycobacterium sp. ACS4331]
MTEAVDDNTAPRPLMGAPQAPSEPDDPPTELIPRIVEHPAEPVAPVLPLPVCGAQHPYPAPLTPVGPLPYPPPELPRTPRVRRKPASGWRRMVHTLTGGLINLGDSPKDRWRRELTLRAAAPTPGDYRIAVLSLKGGVGKTTTTVALGATLAAIRGDRVIAVDANPDFGTLAQRGPDGVASTVRDVLSDTRIARYSDVQAHTVQTESRLEILASEQDPAASETFSALDYKRLIEILHRYYNIILTDCGTGLVHSAMRGVLGEANAVVLVTSPAADSVRSTAATLDWLAFHGHQQLAATATVVVSGAQPGVSGKEVAPVLAYFARRARSVHYVPFDEHLAEGAEVVRARMSRAAQDAFLGIAAALADGFGRAEVRR